MHNPTHTRTFQSKIAEDFVRLLGEEPNSEEVRCQCPFGTCRDNPLATQKTLSVNIIKGSFYCFRCHTSGKPKDIASLLLNKPDFLHNRRNNASSTFVEKKKPKLITIQVSSLPASARDKIFADIRPRLIYTDEQIDSLQFCVSGTRPLAWKNRLLIPVGGLDFGKKIAGFEYPENSPKYLTPTGFSLAEHGYIGLDEADRETIIMTEGLLDYKSLPPGSAIMSPGTAGMANKLVTRLRDRGTILVPDSDEPGVNVFIRGLNNGLWGLNNTIRFSFTYWITGKRGTDINDLLCRPGMTPERVYAELLKVACTPAVTLRRLSLDWRIINDGKKYKIADDKTTNADKTKFKLSTSATDIHWF